jgi:hypothetical protein
MATHSAASPGTSRACPVDSISQVYECDDELVVLVRLNDGLLELRVPRERLASGKHPAHIEGFNADATPC